MSGILGWIGRAGQPAVEGCLRQALDALAPFGRDGAGLWVSGSVGVGHCLNALNRRNGAEPQPLKSGFLTATVDARIDNRSELFASLGIAPGDGLALSDGALVLLAFEKWGAACPERLIGDYAFAIWDARDRTLFAARDHIGTRPFYYYEDNRVFAFASDLPALLACPGVAGDIDEGAIARYLSCDRGICCDPSKTLFKNVFKLPFGCRLNLGEGPVRVERFWRPEAIPQIRLPRIEDYAARLRELICQAVADRLDTHLAVGAHLSGGIDSSSVAVLLARECRARGLQPPAVFSWSLPPGSNPAAGHRRIEAVCRQEELSVRYVDHEPTDLIQREGVDLAVRPALTMSGGEFDVQEMAEALGVRTLFSGWGGDEGVSFNGRGLAAGYLTERRWLELWNLLNLGAVWRNPREIRAAARRMADVVHPMMPDPWYEWLARLRSMVQHCPTFINSGMAKRHRRELAFPRRLRERPGVRACQLQLYLHGHLASRMESWAAYGADHGLTYVYPLVDRRVLEFIYAIPGDLHLQKGRGRFLFRQTVADLLPAGFVWEAIKEDPERIEPIEQRQCDGQFPNWRSFLDEPLLHGDHPWVDLPALRGFLLKEGARSHLAGARRAMECLRIWRVHAQHSQHRAADG